jgi:hypothetical protein
MEDRAYQFEVAEVGEAALGLLEVTVVRDLLGVELILGLSDLLHRLHHVVLLLLGHLLAGSAQADTCSVTSIRIGISKRSSKSQSIQSSDQDNYVTEVVRISDMRSSSVR